MEERIYQGYTYRRSGPGQPWQMVGPAQQAPQPVFSTPADPTIAPRVAKATADANAAAAEAPYAGDIAAATAKKEAAQAHKAEIDAENALKSAQTRENALHAFAASRRLDDNIRHIEQTYNAGPGATKGIASLEDFFNIPSMQAFNKASNAARGNAQQMLGFSATQSNTPLETEMNIGSYIPKASNYDSTILQQIGMLKELRDNARQSAIQVLGGVPDADGNIIPLSQLSDKDRAALFPARTGNGGGNPDGDDIISGIESGKYQLSPHGLTYNGSPMRVPDDIYNSDAYRDLYAKKFGAPPPMQVTITGGGSGGDGGNGSGYADSYLGQGLSGVNEGIASTLGLPVDLTTMGLNLIPKGINAIANTDIPQIENPFMGGAWWNNALTDIGSIVPQTIDPWKQFVRRTGQSVGAAAIPVGATAKTGADAAKMILSALGGGLGGATAQQVAPGNAGAEILAELAGSGLTGVGALAARRRGVQRAIEAEVPSIPDLKGKASDVYRQAKSRGVVAGPNVTSNLAGKVRSIAEDEKLIWPDGKVDPSYPRASAAMNMLEAHAGQSIDPTQIQVMRDNLADAVSSTAGKERRIAKKMLDAFDEETVPLAPELSEGRKIARRYINAGEIKRAIDRAEPRAAQFSQSGTANALKTEFRQLDRNIIDEPYSFNPDVIAAINKVSRGTGYTNAMQRVGKLAPRGTIPITGYGLAGAGSAATGSPTTAIVSALMAGAGEGAQRLADRAVVRNANIAELLARNGGAIDTASLVDDETKKMIAALLAGQEGKYIGN